MSDARHLPAADHLAPRRLALRAIMDGRGIDAAILSSPGALAHYGGIAAAGGRSCLLVVTARAAVPVEAADGSGAWAAAAALLPPGCALGCEGDAGGAEVLERLLRPRRMLSISAEVARQIRNG